MHVCTMHNVSNWKIISLLSESIIMWTLQGFWIEKMNPQCKECIKYTMHIVHIESILIMLKRWAATSSYRCKINNNNIKSWKFNGEKRNFFFISKFVMQFIGQFIFLVFLWLNTFGPLSFTHSPSTNKQLVMNYVKLWMWMRMRMCTFQ